jgi:hypothetical protein
MSRRDHSGRTDLRKASIKRLADAKALLDHPENHALAAMYLAGYAVECKLKAVAMETFDCWTLGQLASRWDVSDADVYTHGLEVFARRLPMFNNLKRSNVWRDFVVTVNQWRPSWRYNPRDASHEKANEFVAAVSRVLQWLEANR